MDFSKKNHGTEIKQAGRSKIMTAFGHDNSDVTGSAAVERGIKMAGGVENLSHSLSGTSANQKGS
jgi:hypothetical protein